MNSSFPTEMYIFLPRSWRYAKNGAETPDGAVLETFHVKNRFQHQFCMEKATTTDDLSKVMACLGTLIYTLAHS